MLEGQVAAYMEQILSATAYCHGRGVLHRDLKPENVCFLNRRPDSPLKVIDFGLSDTIDRLRKNTTKELQDRKGIVGEVARMMPKLPGGLEIIATQVNKEVMQRAGTPHYMAPEVYEGEYADKADCWSIGVMLFEMLCNRHPFFTHGNDADAIKRRILDIQGADFCDPEWKKVSIQGLRACQAALRRDPRKRPSAAVLLAHPWLEGTPRLALGLAVPAPAPDIQQAPNGAAEFRPQVLTALEVLEALRSFAGTGGYQGFMPSQKNNHRLRQALLRLLARELSELQIANLRGTFLRLDHDGDGVLGVFDLKKAIEAYEAESNYYANATDADSSYLSTKMQSPLGSLAGEAMGFFQSFVGETGGGLEAELKSLALVVGTAGISKIGFSDFLAAMMPRHTLIRDSQMRDAFRKLDIFNEGKLTRRAFLDTLQVGKAVPDQEVEELLANIPLELDYFGFCRLCAVQVSD
eukprot:TRINITY_DN10033_c1_g3_i1.p1 TRINITY_DN10033_c1_g3~~TRINITY_DN10033_c1_g3_i1.p1  ORF type:complete len:465 (-),score=103.36 TRINITY_DN10033_c1_g3_i1:125-1519(-)